MQKAVPKATAVGYSHGTNASGERQRPGAVVAWATSGAGPGALSRGARGGTPRMQKAEPKATAVGYVQVAGEPRRGRMMPCSEDRIASTNILTSG